MTEIEALIIIRDNPGRDIKQFDWDMLVSLSNRGLIELTKSSVEIKYDGKRFIETYDLNRRSKNNAHHMDNTQINATQSGMGDKKNWTSEFIMGLLILLIGTILLRILHVI